MATAVVFRGEALISGVAGTITAIAALQQDFDFTQQWDEEIIKDVNGYDAIWAFRNEHGMLDITLKLVGASAAAAAAPITTSTLAPLSTLGTAGTGQPFYSPGATIVLSAFQMLALNGTFQFLPGCKLVSKNTESSTWSLKLREYASADQKAAILVIPT